MPLLAATSASAADTATWDKVAECESGGSWSANFGSGAYGGLQFTQEEWQNAGGLDFAERADLASRSQQIAVAERVLASQGPQAWPLCAASAGLDQQGPAAVVDPGLPGSPKAVGPAPSRPDDVVPSDTGGKPATDFGLSTAETPSPTGSPFLIPDAPSVGLPVMPAPDVPTAPPTTPTAPVTPTDPTTPPVTPTDPTVPALPTDPTAPTTPPGTPSPSPADPAAPAVPGATPAAPSTPGATPAEGNGKHRGEPSPEEGSTSGAAPAPVYTVQAGDSLATIAVAKGVKGGWSGLYAANEQVIGNDANLIKPGQNLDLTAQ